MKELKTLEEARELAREVQEGKTRSYVGSAFLLADFVLKLQPSTTAISEVRSWPTDGDIPKSVVDSKSRPFVYCRCDGVKVDL